MYGKTYGTRLGGAIAVAVACLLMAAPAASAHAHAPAQSLGPNVIVFTPSMPQASIQAQLDSISTQQVPNQFGSQRYELLFEPGTYGSASDPLDFQVGYYTAVAGLGKSPSDVVINGAINVFNQCVNGACDGTNNFWRSVSNLTLNVHLPSTPPNYAPYSGDPYGPGCDNSADFWAVSQAAPMRRVIVNGSLVLQDYCSPTGDVSGGFFADNEFNGGTVSNDGQQQFFTRNSDIDAWSNGVWNQVFMGDVGAPPTSFGPGSNQYTTLASTPVSEEEPFLYTGAGGRYRVLVPPVRHNSVGVSYAGGHSLALERFFVAAPGDSAQEINAALGRGKDLLFTPGVYDLDQTLRVTRPNTVVLGLGFATLIPQRGNVTMRTADVPGIKLSGLIFDAGPQNSPVLLQVGSCWAGGRGRGGGSGRHRGRGRDRGRAGCGQRRGWADAARPTLLQDIFFRIGGAEPGLARDSLVVDTDHTILDDVWAWRADHGAGVGWTVNRAETGVIVNGAHVRAYGLAVEHYQRYEVQWNGENGEDVFFQNEMPYDPPSQAAWMATPSIDGYPAFRVAPQVRHFHGYGMGSYSFFNQGVPIYATEAFESPDPGVQWHDLLTVFLNANGGSGGILSVINGVGGSSTAANADKPVDVASYP